MNVPEHKWLLEQRLGTTDLLRCDYKLINLEREQNQKTVTNCFNLQTTIFVRQDMFTVHLKYHIDFLIFTLEPSKTSFTTGYLYQQS